MFFRIKIDKLLLKIRTPLNIFSGNKKITNNTTNNYNSHPLNNNKPFIWNKNDITELKEKKIIIDVDVIWDKKDNPATSELTHKVLLTNDRREIHWGDLILKTKCH